MIQLKMIPGILDWIIALGSLAAFITALVVFVTLRRNINKDNIEKENQIKNEVLNWIIEVNEFMLNEEMLPPFEETYVKVIKRGGIFHPSPFGEAIKEIIIIKYQIFRMRSVYIERISRSIPELHDVVETAIDQLRRILRLLHAFFDRRGDLVKKENFGHIEYKATRCILRAKDNLYESNVDIMRLIGDFKL